MRETYRFGMSFCQNLRCFLAMMMNSWRSSSLSLLMNYYLRRLMVNLSKLRVISAIIFSSLVLIFFVAGARGIDGGDFVEVAVVA